MSEIGMILFFSYLNICLQNMSIIRVRGLIEKGIIIIIIEMRILTILQKVKYNT